MRVKAASRAGSRGGEGLPSLGVITARSAGPYTTGVGRPDDPSLLKLPSALRITSSSPSRGVEYATQSVEAVGESTKGSAKPPERVGVVGGEGMPPSLPRRRTDEPALDPLLEDRSSICQGKGPTMMIGELFLFWWVRQSLSNPLTFRTLLPSVAFLATLDSCWAACKIAAESGGWYGAAGGRKNLRLGWRTGRVGDMRVGYAIVYVRGYGYEYRMTSRGGKANG